MTTPPAASPIRLGWEVISNRYGLDRCLLELTIENRAAEPLEGTDWAIYFNAANPPLPVALNDGERVEQVNGDVYRIVPTEQFVALEPGESRKVRYLGFANAIQHTDGPRGVYLVRNDGTKSARATALGDAVIAPFTRPEQLTRNGRDLLPVYDAGVAYGNNEASCALPAAEVGKITPTPHTFQALTGELLLDASSTIAHDPLLVEEARLLQRSLADLMSGSLSLSSTAGKKSVRLTLDTNLVAPPGGISAEAYRLEVTPTGAVLTGATAEAVARGIQSLLQLLPTQVWLEKAAILPVPCCSVFDAPRYGYRGMLLDVARNFSSKQTVLRLLDVMALYKLNRLHLHLSDDEGWRLAIPELPELTEYGSRRTFSPDEKDGLPPSFGSGASTDSMGSGCYSREDFLEILRYAKARHIMVIPEIDVPGHARAAIKSMEVRYRRLLASGNTAEAAQYLLTDLEDQSVYKSVQGWRDNVICIGLESSYAFIEVVVTALKQMFVEAGAPLHAIHVGGDETPVGCWEKSAQCAAFMQQHGLRDVHVLRDHFYERLRDIFDRNDLVLAGWEEIALLPVALTDTTVKPNPKFVGSRFLPYVWNNALAGNAKGLVREDVAHRLANAGYEIVLCSVTNLYLDLAYEKHPAEPGYYWGGFINARKVYEFCPNEPLTTATVKLNGTPIEPELVARLERLKPEAEHRVLGMQGQLWGENMRSAEILEYFLLPRVVALAERAWAKDPGWHLIEDVTVRNATIAREWNEFANRLGQRELPRMDGFGGGFAYRVPVPGALLRDGMLFANICTPGFVLRYTTDGSEPTPTSPRYEAPVAAGYAKVAAFTSLGRRGRSAIAS